MKMANRRKFLKATEKGYRFAIENPQKSAEILLAEVPELEREIVIASQKYQLFIKNLLKRYILSTRSILKK